MTYQIVAADGLVLATFDRLMAAKRALQLRREAGEDVRLVVYDKAGKMVGLAETWL